MTDTKTYINEQLVHAQSWIFYDFGLGFFRGLQTSKDYLKKNNEEQLKAHLLQKVKDVGSFEVKKSKDQLGEFTAYLDILAAIDGEPLFTTSTELQDIRAYADQNLTITVREEVKSA